MTVYVQRHCYDGVQTVRLYVRNNTLALSALSARVQSQVEERHQTRWSQKFWSGRTWYLTAALAL